jgi:hypothetical protein
MEFCDCYHIPSECCTDEQDQWVVRMGIVDSVHYLRMLYGYRAWLYPV